MIFVIDPVKASDKIQYQFLTKSLSRVGTEGSFLNVIKGVYQNTTVNITFNGEKLNVFPQSSVTRKGCPSPPLLFSIMLEVLDSAVKIRKGNRRHPEWKLRSKILFIHRLVSSVWKI